MANKTIAELTAASTPDGTELTHIVQSGNSRKATINQINAAGLLDEDDFASDSANKAPSQQSVAAYLASVMPIVTDWVAFTPTLTGFGTPTNVSFFSRRVGDTLQIRGTFTSGSSSGVEGRFSLGHDGTDGNVTSSSSKLRAGTNLVGMMTTSNAAGYRHYMLAERSVGYLTYGIGDGSFAGLTKANGNDGISNGGVYSFFAEVPVEGW